MLSRHTAHERANVTMAVKRIVKTYCFTRRRRPAAARHPGSRLSIPGREPSPSTESSGIVLEEVAEDLAQPCPARSRPRAARAPSDRRLRRGSSRRRSSRRRPCATDRRRGRRPTLSPSMSCASSMRTAAGLPVRFALETARGPVSSSSSSAMRWAGIRTATVPRVSPRSHDSEGCDGRTIVRPPGQNASTRRSTGSGTSATRARSVVRPATRTGGGDCRPRPFASSRRCTALALNASAATP